MSSSDLGDKVTEAAEAADIVVGQSAGLVPPIRLVWGALTVAWKAATATAREHEAWQSWRTRSSGERQATFEEVEQARKEAEELRDALGAGMAALVMWPFLVLLWLILLPLALPSSIPTLARTALAIVYYGLMAWLVPTWVVPALAEQLDGWWRWAVIVFMFAPIVGGLINAGIAWLVTVLRRNVG